MLSKLKAFQFNAFLQFGTISKIFNIEKGRVTLLSEHQSVLKVAVLGHACAVNSRRFANYYHERYISKIQHALTVFLTSGYQLVVLEWGQRRKILREIVHFSLDNKMHRRTVFAFDFVSSLVV